MKNNLNNDLKGYYGPYGGSFVPQILNSQLEKLDEIFTIEKSKGELIKEYNYYLKHYVGRPSPLYFAKNLSELTGSKIYFKREDLNHTGSHKINNTIGQILLAKQMGAKEIIAETGAGQHGFATATAAALMGIHCKIFMGAKDIKRQQINVDRIRLLGAEVIETSQGQATLKDAVDAALLYYIKHPDSYYLLGSQVGPHPYPNMVGFFQSVIGKEAREQIYEQEKRLPDSIFACVGGGSNAIGLFNEFLDFDQIEIHGAEGGGNGYLSSTAATLSFGKIGIFQGSKSYCLMDDNNQPLRSYSIAAGLDYPGISPQHAFLKDNGRAKYHIITDNEAICAFQLCSKKEGIIPAIESAHAIALAMKYLKNKNHISIVNLSGRGDKEIGREEIIS